MRLEIWFCFVICLAETRDDGTKNKMLKVALCLSRKHTCILNNPFRNELIFFHFLKAVLKIKSELSLLRLKVPTDSLNESYDKYFSRNEKYHDRIVFTFCVNFRISFALYTTFGSTNIYILSKYPTGFLSSRYTSEAGRRICTRL